MYLVRQTPRCLFLPDVYARRRCGLVVRSHPCSTTPVSAERYAPILFEAPLMPNEGIRFPAKATDPAGGKEPLVNICPCLKAIPQATKPGEPRQPGDHHSYGSVDPPPTQTLAFYRLRHSPAGRLGGPTSFLGFFACLFRNGCYNTGLTRAGKAAKPGVAPMSDYEGCQSTSSPPGIQPVPKGHLQGAPWGSGPEG